MHAMKIQTKAGRKMSETGFIPELFNLGSFWDGNKPLFERVDIDLDELPKGTVLRVNRETIDANPLYFRKEATTTNQPWVRLSKESEAAFDGYVALPSTWIGFERANELMIIYTPETH